ncbi:hypothetical protein AKJ09_01609 [Labilithrix luteola]|uniref:Uncharacterized protein n=1 Tax=Labilithrix luteola TaxID=1391654 RepID=A0A0K1PN27_9BACT|nr:hypothetical protein AKJ09_01609 [Labilithrix luteola]
MLVAVIPLGRVRPIDGYRDDIGRQMREPGELEGARENTDPQQGKNDDEQP